MGEDGEGQRGGDGVGNLRIGEGGVFDQVVLREALAGSFVKFGFPTLKHERAGGVGCPVLGDHRGEVATEAEGACADVEEVVVGCQAVFCQQGKDDAGRFVPAAADDVAVAALGERVVVEAGGGVGGGVFHAAPAARRRMASIRSEARSMSCTETHSRGP